MLIEEQKSYRQIFKATSLFGGVQVFSIIITIIRSKIIAVLLGPIGMGIAGLLISTTGLIGGLSNFGLNISAVKDVAAANQSGDKDRISRIVAVLMRLMWITGTLGSLITLIFSSWLSQLTFGNKDYTFAFVWLSITLLFNQLTNGQSVLLQGMRKLQYLAKANMIGSFLGLVVSVPIYYIWRIDGIVAAIILSSVFALFTTWYFTGKVNVTKVKVTRIETIQQGKGMMKMGFMLSLSGLITLGASYIVRIFISNTGGVEDVGLYNAGFAIITTYVGMVFTAMGTDYFPRLSGVAQDNKQASQLINQQSEVAILILAPILNIFLIFINWVVILLYSNKFTPVDGMLHWAALGMYFKAVSWSVAFILLAKGASGMFFWNELIASIYMLGLNILGYRFYGLDGLGVSFLIGYIIYLLQVFYLVRIKYQFSFNNAFMKIFSIQLILGLICFSLIKYVSIPWAYIAGIPFISFSSWLSFKELDKRMGLKDIYRDYFKK